MYLTVDSETKLILGSVPWKNKNEEKTKTKNL